MAFCQSHHSQMVIIFWLLSQCQNPESHMTRECRVPSDRDQGEDIAYNQNQPLPGLDVLTPTLFGWRKKTLQGECASSNPWQAVLLHFKGIASGRSVLPNKKGAISGKHRLWSPDQYKIKNNVPHTGKSVLPNYAFWRRAENDIEGFHVAFTSEWIHSALDIKILSEDLLLSSSSIPASPVLTLLMHVTSRITQASLPTEQSPNSMSMQSITQNQITTPLDSVTCSSPQTTPLLLSVTSSQTFLTNESLPMHPWFFWQKKKPCVLSITLRDRNNN